MSQTIRLTQPKKQSARVVSNTGIPLRPGQQPNVSFVYVVYPRGWEFIEGFGFLPRLKRVLAKPGVNGVDSRGRLSKALAGVVEKGGVVVQPSDERLGEYKGYVQYYETTDGRKWYCDFCTTVTVLPNGEVFWGLTTPNARNEFRAFLRENNIVPMLVPEVFEVLVSKEEKRLEEIGKKVLGNPAIQAKYDEKVRQIDSMRSWWDNRNKSVAKKTKKKPVVAKKIARIELD